MFKLPRMYLIAKISQLRIIYIMLTNLLARKPMRLCVWKQMHAALVEDSLRAA